MGSDLPSAGRSLSLRSVGLPRCGGLQHAGEHSGRPAAQRPGRGGKPLGEGSPSRTSLLATPNILNSSYAQRRQESGVRRMLPDYRVGLDLYEHLRRDQPRHLDHAGRRTYLPEHLAVRPPDLLPAIDIRHVDPRLKASLSHLAAQPPGCRGPASPARTGRFRAHKVPVLTRSGRPGDIH
jgi:hypothetical protein